MPWVPTAGDSIDVSVFCRLDDQVSVNVLQYVITGIGGAVSGQQAADAFDARLNDTWRLWLCDDASYEGVKVLRTNGVNIPPPVFSSANAGGGAAGGALPRQLCGLGRKFTDFAGPKGRGRLYAPFPGDANRAGMVLSAGGLTALGSIMADAYGVDGLITVGALSLEARIGIRAGSVGRRVTAVDISAEFASQLRRGAFGRKNSLPTGLV